jgi:hypothetical protein
VSLLTLCQNVILETGAGASPSAIVSNTDTLAKQLLAWANKEARILAKRDWQAITAEHTITTAASTETYALPTNYARYVSDTFWDATNYWPMRGSIAPQHWQALKRGLVSSSIRKEFRVRGNLVYIFPTPDAIETLIGEYITNKPVVSSAAVAKTIFTADDDTTLIPEFLVELGVKWRLLDSKGFDYTEAKQEYDRQVELALAQDSPAPAINLGYCTEYAPPFPNIPQQI